EGGFMWHLRRGEGGVVDLAADHVGLVVLVMDNERGRSDQDEEGEETRDHGGHSTDPAGSHFTGSAFQILRSSKKPSLPMQPNSTFDFVGWAMPGDCRKATGLPSIVALMVSPTVSSMNVCHVAGSRLTG